MPSSVFFPAMTFIFEDDFWIMSGIQSPFMSITVWVRQPLFSLRPVFPPISAELEFKVDLRLSESVSTEDDEQIFFAIQTISYFSKKSNNLKINIYNSQLFLIIYYNPLS